MVHVLEGLAVMIVKKHIKFGSKVLMTMVGKLLNAMAKSMIVTQLVTFAVGIPLAIVFCYVLHWIEG
jgi:hypothetical protein